MPQLDINQLVGSLKSGLKPLYVLHGEEDLLRIEAVDTLRAAAKRLGYLNRESYTVDSPSFDWGEVLAGAGSAGLFADLKLLEIHVPNGKVGKNGGEALLQLAENLPPDAVVLIVLPKLEKAQISSKWFGALAKNGVVLEAKAVTGAVLPAWIGERLQQQGLSAEPEAVALFAERVEGNLLAAKQEIDKLVLLHPKGHLITVQDAEQAVANVARFDVFQLAAAWMGGDVRRVMRLLDGLEAEGDEPVLLVWAVAEDVRTLIRLSAALKQGKSVQAVRNELRLWGDKQTLAPKAVARLSAMRLIEALQECARIDRQIKGAEDGDAWATFRQLMMKLAV
ncbi:DNA polymerase III subunit delta [Kingella negevensis]|uniref:DNA polymerase III subunit delta n=1 Tax=Kingella negevensis TaxID=1522312 RepID=A0A238TBW0_9NEIS|nr:DNA polymerase III subunit delta [Kingella negevensis]MDK4680588.1 DNA polymerase III subunit delta [Kingella negevensis]MDK4681689.1 DNA polymerase III subunit delta [Kingella negevensis]MDK4685190.1 DNA polymerase III subunit delta [Kingella negevensis]MDK4689887.1 DNA polymerase III subunit delta [Kingella negevensis]MDK4692769.1 DNA polymerase III subunit delta [Kingella negevensis]